MPEIPLLEQINQAIEVMLRGDRPPAEPAGLVSLAADLLHLPDERFKSRLKAELQRRKPMTASATYRTIREGFRTVTPYINVAQGEEFIQFLKGAFGAVETARNTGGRNTGGEHAFHAEVRVGDSMLMIGASAHGNNPGRFHVYVEDCDAVFRNAVAAGGKSLGEPADRPYGERSGFVEDAFGNVWYIGTPLPGAPPREHAGTVVPYLHPTKARAYIDFLNHAFGAEELFVVEHNGAVPHAAVRIGNAVIEMGEGPSQRVPSGYFMYVDDVDAVYARAVAAGATGIRPPADQSYGHRDATVRDMYGYVWTPASLLG